MSGKLSPLLSIRSPCDRFEKILTSHDFGYGKTGSVVIFGGVEYCYKVVDGDGGDDGDDDDEDDDHHIGAWRPDGSC